MNKKPQFPYRWKKSDGYPAKNIENHGSKVFTTFSCGGGSSMGYKLAGYNVIGANDIDPQMAKIYQKNHNPKHYFLCPVGELKHQKLPEELFDLDILDGSPPCSTFSLAGSREKAWKVEKKFREWQAKQILSDLFFEWIDLVDFLRPKIAIAENVKWMLIGNAKIYTKNVVKELEKIWYETQIFLLNGASMGLPQARERVFFICKRKDLNFPKISLNFNEKIVPFSEIDEWYIEWARPLTETQLPMWEKCKPGKPFSSVHPKKSFFNHFKVSPDKPLATITAGAKLLTYHHSQPRTLTNKEFILGGSFPLDYDFMDIDPVYAVGMSVPPVMMANIAHEVWLQLLKPMKNQ